MMIQLRGDGGGGSGGGGAAVARSLLLATLTFCIFSLSNQVSLAFSLKMSTPTPHSLPTTKKTAIIAGATGYIGKAVVQESVRQGYKTYALVRDKGKVLIQNEDDINQSSTSSSSATTNLLPAFTPYLEGAELVECDVTDPEALTKAFEVIKEESGEIDAIISCLASRSGIKKDAYAIDYQATKNCLDAGLATHVKARHFVLLSAFCVKNPLLQFQKAKLQFEADLQNQNDMTWSIVRPTAYFKSLSLQVEKIQQGSPFVLFGNGEVTRCNPIAESDLATYMVDCIKDKSRQNRILNLGGPDDPITNKRQGEMIFRAVGKEPNYAYAPLWPFDAIINTCQFLADVLKSEQLENAAELGRIGKYYAVEDMLTTDPSEKFGTISLQEHYNRIAVEGDEFDPYTQNVSLISGLRKLIPT